MSEQPPNQWGQNPYQQPQNQPTQPLGAQPQWGGQQGPPHQWGNQSAQSPYAQQQWGAQGPSGPGGPMGPGGPTGPGGNKKTLWLVLTAVVVLVAAAVVVAILVFTGDDDDDKDDAKGDETSSTSPSGSESASESSSAGSTQPTDPTTSASTDTSSTADDGDVLFTFPNEVDGRTLDSSTGPDGGKVGADDSFISATYKGSDMTDMVIYQYMTSLDAKSYAEATDNSVEKIGDAYCAKVLDSMEAYACAVDYGDGILFTSSNMTTVSTPEEVAATLQKMVETIG